MYKNIVLFGAFLFLSCNQKEMKIARASESIQTEMNDFSPVYFEKNAQGELAVQENGLIGNTHWVISVDRELTLEQIAPTLKKMVDKKFHKEGLHKDSKEIYFIYSDTLHKQLSYVKMPFRYIDVDRTTFSQENKENLYNFSVRSYSDFNENIDAFFESKSDETKLHITLDKTISTEDFVAILIEIQKRKLNDFIDENVSVL